MRDRRIKGNQIQLQEFFQRLLVAYKGTVYDITDFQNLHPAGRSPLQTHKGKELENQILFNPQYHRHSRTILNTLELYKIGQIETKLSSPSPMNSTTGTKTTALTHSQTSQQKTQLKKTETTPQKQPIKTQAEANKKSESHTERLNQSFSMTSSQQFLAPPNHQDIIKQQKIKQQKLMQEWKQKEIEEIKRQQEVIKQEQIESRKVQSEIFSNNETRKKSINPYYQQWLDSKRKSELESQTSLQQSLTQSVQNLTEKKKSNPYYEEWKKKQMQQQTKRKSINIITEEDESLISPSVNNSFQRSQSAVSSRKSMAQEEPQLQVPQFQPKFLAQIKKKYQ
ncbi:hypothetical protein pb186bvf_010736 [Paramecium bursaria]